MGRVDEITRELAILIPRMIRGAQAALLAESSLTMPQFVILLSLLDTGPASVTDIARGRKVSPPTATRLVDRLIAGGLVQRLEDPRDRRRVIVDLTARGRKAVLSFQEGICERWRQVLVHLSDDKQQSFLEGVRSVVAVMAQLESAGRDEAATDATRSARAAQKGRGPHER